MRNALGTKPSRRLTRQEVRGVEREEDFGKNGFDARLAGFARDDGRDVVPVKINRIAKAEQRCAAMS